MQGAQFTLPRCDQLESTQFSTKLIKFVKFAPYQFTLLGRNSFTILTTETLRFYRTHS